MCGIREGVQRLLGTVRRGRRDDDLQEELRTHVALAAERGRRETGAPQAVEAMRDQRSVPWLENVARDVGYGFRSLRRSPAFATVALLTLTLGIGANAAIFQLLDAIRIRSLPVQDPEQLAIVDLADWTRWGFRRASGYPVLTNPLWERFREEQRAFTGVLAWANTELWLDEGTALRAVPALFVSGDFFHVLGVPASLGRVFSAADDRRGCDVPGAVVSHGFWQRQLASDPRAIGRTLRLNNRLVEVIGVTSGGFSGLEVGRSFDIAVPICSHAALGTEDGWLTSDTLWWLTVMGRLAPDHTLEQASVQLATLSPGLFEATLPPGLPSELAAGYLGLKLRASPGAAGISALRNRFSDPLVILLATSGLVLLMVCTNLASLVLSRASTRQREFAVRQALGASRWRLVQQAMAENALLAFAGAAAGVAVAGPLGRLLLGFLGPEVSVALRVDARLLAIGAAAALATCVTFGLAPAWRAARSAASSVTATASMRGAAASAGGVGLRQALVVAQIAVSLVLVVGALLFLATLRNLLASDIGFEHENVYVARVDASLMDLPQSSKAAFKRDVLDRTRRIPGVTTAAEVRHVPMGGTGSRPTVWREGDEASKTDVLLNAISDGYLETLGIRLLAGRDFTPRDSASAPRVAIVNPSFVRQLGIAGTPVGQRFLAEGPSPVVYEIVGFVPDTAYSDVGEQFRPIVFVPMPQITDPRSFTDLMIRSEAPLSEVSSGLTRALADVSSLLTVDVRAFDATIDQRLSRERLMATLSSFFGILAILIAAVGVYGVVAESVTRRRNEIGVRMALGASRSQIVAMVLRQAAVLLLIGLAGGVVFALTVAGSTRSLVFGLEPRDMGPIGLGCACLAAAAAAAILIPACRAATLEPITALREG